MSSVLHVYIVIVIVSFIYIYISCFYQLILYNMSLSNIYEAYLDIYISCPLLRSPLSSFIFRPTREGKMRPKDIVVPISILNATSRTKRGYRQSSSIVFLNLHVLLFCLCYDTLRLMQAITNNTMVVIQQRQLHMHSHKVVNISSFDSCKDRYRQ